MLICIDKYPSRGYEGGGVQVGETIETRIDRRNGTARWLVNGVQRSSYNLGILGEIGRMFMPYV